MAKSPMVALTCRIPAELSAALDARAEHDAKDRSEIVRLALQAYLSGERSLEDRVVTLETTVARITA